MPDEFLVFSRGGECTRKVFADPGGGFSISAPVGNAPRCPNKSDDVKAVQTALNRFVPGEGGPLPPLKVDGWIGPKTNKAISDFQKLKFGKADGVVDVDGPTIHALRGNSSGEPQSPTALKHLTAISNKIWVARRTLGLARDHLRRGGMSKPYRILDRHFHLDQVKDKLATIERIDRVYIDMLTAIGYIPQGITLFRDVPAELDDGNYAFAYSGGYQLLRRGKDHPKSGLALDSIHLEGHLRTFDSTGVTYVLLHELGHYVGPPHRGVDITDFAYRHRAPGKYEKLTAQQALRNADSYSQFAFEADNEEFIPEEHGI